MKKKRKILFLICFLLFLLTAPTTILYSLGYRFDIHKLSITQTGGLYFKAWPKQAEIWLNGEPKKKTDFLFGSVLIENLLPGRYLVEIKKDGFYAWKKELKVQAKKVTSAKNVILFPKNLAFQPVKENVAYFSTTTTSTLSFLPPKVFEKEKGRIEFKNFLLKEKENALYLSTPKEPHFKKIAEGIKGWRISPDLKKIAYFSDHEIWVYFLEKQTDQPIKKRGEKILIARFSKRIGDVFWVGSNYLVFNVNNEIKIGEIDERDTINIVSIASFKNPKIYFSNKTKKLYVLNQGKVFSSLKLLP